MLHRIFDPGKETRCRVGLVVLLPLAVVLLVGCSERHTLVVTATAYNSLPSQTDDLPGLAAWGDELRPGMRVLAVSLDLVELGLTRGTRVHVEGLPGTYVVMDRMASRFERRIDIYMGEDVERAREWGRRKVRITWWGRP